MWIFGKLQIRSHIYSPHLHLLTYSVCASGMCTHVCAWWQQHAMVCLPRFYDQVCFTWKSTIWTIGIKLRSWCWATGTFTL